MNELREKVEKNECKLFKPLENTSLLKSKEPESYESLSFFKDVLLMLLDLSATPNLACKDNLPLIKTLLDVFCELLDDEKIMSKSKDSKQEENTVAFILKILLACTQ